MDETSATMNGDPERKSKRNMQLLKDLVKLRRPEDVSILNFSSTVLMAGFIFGALVLAIGDDFLPDGAAWATLLIWASANVGGMLMTKIRMPALLGMLLSGILLKNLPDDPVKGLPEEWSSSIRAAGLSVILMRSGLEMDTNAIKEAGAVAMRLTVMPGVLEAVSVGVFGLIIFGMPMFLSLSLGFILGAVSPAVVVIGMFDLQRRGYGVKKGIPSLVVAAASFDDVVAISGFSIFIGLAIPTGGNLAWELAHGPLNLVFGIAGGSITGAICALTGLWNDRAKRTLVVFVLGMVQMFLGHHYHFTGAGAMASLIMGIVANILWAKGWPGEKSMLGGPPDTHFAHVVEADLAKLWTAVAQPLLFGVIGAAVDFGELTPSTIPKALGLVCLGVVVRLSAAFVALGGAGLTFKERLFISLAWIPKATVQAALASVPKDLIHEEMDPNDPDYEDYKDWGEDILTAAVFSIILTAPVGLIVINKLGDKWLSKDDEDEPASPSIAEEGTKGDEPNPVGNGTAAALSSDVEAGSGKLTKSLSHSSAYGARPVAAPLSQLALQKEADALLGPRYELMQLWLLAEELEKTPQITFENAKIRASRLRRSIKELSMTVAEVSAPKLLDTTGSFFQAARERRTVEQLVVRHRGEMRANLTRINSTAGRVGAPPPERIDEDSTDDAAAIRGVLDEDASWATRTL